MWWVTVRVTRNPCRGYGYTQGSQFQTRTPTPMYPTRNPCGFCNPWQSLCSTGAWGAFIWMVKLRQSGGWALQRQAWSCSSSMSNPSSLSPSTWPVPFPSTKVSSCSTGTVCSSAWWQPPRSLLPSVSMEWDASWAWHWAWWLSACCVGARCDCWPCWLLLTQGVHGCWAGPGPSCWSQRWSSSWLPALTSECHAHCTRIRSAGLCWIRVWTPGPVCLLRLDTLDRRPGTCLQRIRFMIWRKNKTVTYSFNHSRVSITQGSSRFFSNMVTILS